MFRFPVPSFLKKIPILKWLEFTVGILITVLVLFGIGYWIWRAFNLGPSALPGTALPVSATLPSTSLPSALMPNSKVTQQFLNGLRREMDFHTVIPTRSPDWVTEYTIQKGDTVNDIAAQFGLKPASLVWGNPELLAVDANMLQPGQLINILPVDGAYYQWKAGDTLESVAAEWNTTVDAIVSWPGNEINPLNPVLYPHQWIILPGGIKPYEWEAPMIRNGHSTTFALGAGACPNGYNGTAGTMVFGWPTTSHFLSGTNYLGAMHPGIDIYIYSGQPIMAADNGVVVYAGWSQNRDGTPGYGNLVIIDHLNGWHTFYGHLRQINVGCGQQVRKGEVIALGDSTGNSTGPHLHFEMRNGGIPQNPWDWLPPS